MISTIISYGDVVVLIIYLIVYWYKIIMRYGDVEEAADITLIAILAMLIIFFITEVLKCFGL